VSGRALYIEIDAYCREWLRNLIAADLICPGDVVGDILDVRPRDLDRYNQVHAFAGIGIWSGSLRDAGYQDTDHVWTGSCPCQPFSAAGQRGGFADERHLWPAFFHLIEQCRPPKVFGEQVASPDGLRWLDLVSSDLEGARYAIGAADLCAAGIAVAAGETEIGQPTLEWIRRAVQSCPDPFLAAELRDYAEWFDREAGIGPAHIRQRLCWMAYATGSGHERWRSGETSDGRDAPRLEPERLRDAGTMAHANEGQRGRVADRQGCKPDRAATGRQKSNGEFESGRAVERLGISDSSGRASRCEPAKAMGHGHSTVTAGGVHVECGPDQRLARPTSLAGWTRADWIICTDGKARPIEPGTFPLAHGQSNRVGRLRAYGNAMHRAKITQFILAADEAIGGAS
jgi:DNA (cytosine-5)-methyltransferase 1